MTHATILAIGTELVQGQTLNRNAAWISERLTALGIETISHVTVSDDEERILSALELAARESELIIVTGGLGPTTDDFTRNVLSRWAGLELEFSPSAWDKIFRRLSERGIEVAESNRQQAFFPKSAVILENGEGTADGFHFKHLKSEVLALPGPPREGKHIWDRHVDSWLRKSFGEPTPVTLETWSCVGISESKLGEIVEAAVAGFEVKTGYRASMPYVEVKLWLPAEYPVPRKLALLSKMNEVLSPYSVARNGEDLALQFARAIAAKTDDSRITFIDFGSDGKLTERLLSFFRMPAGSGLKSRCEIMTRTPDENSQAGAAHIDALPETATEWIFGLFSDGVAIVLGPNGKIVRTLLNPYPHPSLMERLAGYRSEMALKVWREMLLQ